MYYYCDINSIDNLKQKITNPKQIIGRGAPSRARQLIKKHDILFSTVRTYLKNIAIVPDNLHGQLASTGFCIIRSIINHKFIFYYVQSKSFLDVINNIQRGTSYPAVRNNDVLLVPVPVPPLNEQKRIATKIESIFAQFDTKQQELEQLASQIKSVPDSVAELKNSILKKAFEGRLVPQDPRDEPAEILLKKIHKGPAKDLNFEKREHLPKGWIMTTIHRICTTKSGGTPSRKQQPEYFEGGIPWVKSGELNDSVIYSCEETISKLGLEKSSAILYPKNTVLLAMYGATIGKVSILGFEAATNQAICAFFS